jgi:enamine deaminase RidA (YjgF/YER057c/UK114 family)
MLYKTVTNRDGNATAAISVFYPGTDNRTATVTGKNTGVCEYQLIIRITEAGAPFGEQLKTVFDFLNEIRENDLNRATIVFQRFFLSDTANQVKQLTDLLPENKNNVSIIGQAPLNGSKIALWAYLQTGMNVSENKSPSGLYGVQHGEYTHLWKGMATGREGDAESQMYGLLKDYVTELKDYNCTLADNCIRTWIFVRDMEADYAGIVKARRELFAENGLTEKTHYISSTGISGRHANPKAGVILDAYAVKGIRPGQVQYLYAGTHLNPTHEYGVTFERGTCIRYGDRRHVFISGTASIDNKGKIVCEGDVNNQAARMIENVMTLLKEAECGFEDIAHIIVYLRDTADYRTVRTMMEQQFPEIPKIILLAPVCRPGWLVEMECLAVRNDHNKEFAPL